MGAASAFAPRRAEQAKPLPSAAPPPAAEPEADYLSTFSRSEKKAADVLGSADGAEAIAVSKSMQKMKQEQRAPDSSQPFRVAGGRTYVWRDGGWIDSESIDAPAKQQLKVKYLSAAYFALLKARPDLKAGLALGNRVVLVVAKGKAVIVSPNEGEEAAEKLTAFLK